MRVSSKKSRALGLKAGVRRSPVLEKCCLLLAANESFQNAERDLELLMGIKVGHSSQHRCVQAAEIEEPQVNHVVAGLSTDGGKVRLRTAGGGECQWRDDRAIRLHGSKCIALFQDNDGLIAWTNKQHLSSNLTCIGDGHDGIWNIIDQIGHKSQRREILDWYHQKEHLYKVGGSHRRLKLVESYLWQGMWSEANDALTGANPSQVSRFKAYITKHRHRIPDYQLYQELGICIGSGAVESTIKQIGMRLKISGSQWNSHNVTQMLKLRCAYLNGDIRASIYA